MQIRLDKMRGLYPDSFPVAKVEQDSQDLKSSSKDSFQSMKHEKEPDISTLFGDALVGLIPAYDFLTDVFFVKLVYDTFQEQRKVLD